MATCDYCLKIADHTHAKCGHCHGTGRCPHPFCPKCANRAGDDLPFTPGTCLSCCGEGVDVSRTLLTGSHPRRDGATVALHE